MRSYWHYKSHHTRSQFIIRLTSSRMSRCYAALSLLLVCVCQGVAAQKTSATCTPEWDWLSNRGGESPCAVAAQLLSLCSSRPAAYALGSGSLYIPSSDSSVSLMPNTCSCNIVTYNLLMACQACQKDSSPSQIPSWAEYSKECSICSTETGISPGPCGQQTNAGFPASVHPSKGSIAVPLWAVENSSGSKWNASSAHKIASVGGQKVIEGPNSAVVAKEAASTSDKASSADGKQEMKGAVIACSCLAGVILLCFSIYLLRLWLYKRKERKLREFGDEAFDKVVPTASKGDSKADANGLTTPLKLNFKNMVARMTIALPKTPRTPGMVEKMPSTPLTARFWNFGKRDTKKLSTVSLGEEAEYLAEKSVRFVAMPGHASKSQKSVSRRYERFDFRLSEARDH